MRQHIKFLTNILQLIVNPAKGWEDISHDHDDHVMLSRVGFYPLLGIGTLSCFMNMLKIGQNVAFMQAFESAIIMLTVYFATLFIAGAAFGYYMPKISYKEPSTLRNTTFIVYTLSIMLLIEIIINIIPINFPVLYFLPIYLGVIMYKGTAYAGINPDKEGHFMFLSVFSIIAPPYLLGLLFKTILQG